MKEVASFCLGLLVAFVVMDVTLWRLTVRIRATFGDLLEKDPNE